MFKELGPEKACEDAPAPERGRAIKGLQVGSAPARPASGEL
jgi:hypothetical protein